MKYRSFIPLILCAMAGVTLPDNAFARSLKASADKLADQIVDIGMSVSVIALLLASLSVALGLSNSKDKLAQAVGGSFCFVFAFGIIKFIREVA